VIRVWDLPIRLFHWVLVLLVTFSIICAHVGGNWMDWHMRSGYCILTLLLFRILWGFAGSYHARFASFIRSPAVVLEYARRLRAGGAAPHDGHNPLGALSVIAMLVVLSLQVATGLFANDSIASEGPLAHLVSQTASDGLSEIHEFSQWVIYFLIGLHVAAIAYYYFVKRDDLFTPMLTGDRSAGAAVAAVDDARLRWRAAGVLAVAAGLAAFVVTR
jgi:cytochrome b